MKRTTKLIVAMSLVPFSLFGGAGGCTDERDTSQGTLTLTATATDVSGRYTLLGQELAFASSEIEAGVLDVVVDLNGMTLTAIVDRNAQIAEVDGFAQNGGDTQIVDADRAVLTGFVQALALEIDPESTAAASALYRAASNWAETPDSMPLQRLVAGSENRDYVSLCSLYGVYLDATHDDSGCNAFDPQCTSVAQIGNRLTPTYSYINGQWTTQVPNHISYVYQTGDCYGNCGGGCPGTSPQTLTLDCHDHDQCVRNGHFIASFYCNDEFASASDDEFFAPRCSGT